MKKYIITLLLLFGTLAALAQSDPAPAPPVNPVAIQGFAKINGTDTVHTAYQAGFGFFDIAGRSWVKNLFTPLADSTAGGGYVTNYALKTRLADTVSYNGFKISVKGSFVLVSPGNYSLNDSTYLVDGSKFIVDAPDRILSRYDVIYGDTTGKLDTLSGILSLSPAVPPLPPYTIEIAQVLIAPGGTSVIPPDPYFVKEGNISQHIQGTKTFDDAEGTANATKPMQFATLEQLPDAILNQNSFEQPASAWINGNIRIDFQQNDVGLTINNGLGTAIASRGHNYFGNAPGQLTDFEIEEDAQVDASYKLHLIDPPVGPTDAVNLGYLQSYLASTLNSYPILSTVNYFTPFQVFLGGIVSGNFSGTGSYTNYSPAEIQMNTGGVEVADYAQTGIHYKSADGSGFGTFIERSPTALSGNITVDWPSVSGTLAVVQPSGQVTLKSGSISISIIGVTASGKALVSFVSIGGTVTTTWQYAGVCTAGTLTITALTNMGTTDTNDASTVNYQIIQ